MCGIVGFTGAAQAAPILLDGLAKLEYRGYDRSEERRVGKECLRLCRSRWSPYH